MSGLHEPIEQHIHADLCSEVNNTIIALKLNSGEILDNSTEEQKSKILAARGSHKMPSTTELVDLLTRVRDEMNQCTKPFKRY